MGLSDALRSHGLSRDHVSAVRRVFLTLDTQGDQVLDLADLVGFLEAQGTVLSETQKHVLLDTESISLSALQSAVFEDLVRNWGIRRGNMLLIEPLVEAKQWNKLYRLVAAWLLNKCTGKSLPPVFSEAQKEALDLIKAVEPQMPALGAALVSKSEVEISSALFKINAALKAAAMFSSLAVCFYISIFPHVE